MELTVDIPAKHLLKLNTAVVMYENGQLSAGVAAEFGCHKYISAQLY